MTNWALKQSRWIALLIVLLLAASLSSEVWAAASQIGLRQTVPTRTPTKPPATPVPPTATLGAPTEAPNPATPTPESKKDKPRSTSLPIAAPVASATALSARAAEPAATAVAIAEAGFPASGANRTSLFISAAVLAILVSLTLLAWLYRRIKRAL